MKIRKSTRVVFVNMLALLIALIIGIGGPAGTVLADGGTVEPPLLADDSLVGSPENSQGENCSDEDEEECAFWFMILNTLLM